MRCKACNKKLEDHEIYMVDTVTINSEKTDITHIVPVHEWNDLCIECVEKSGSYDDATDLDFLADYAEMGDYSDYD